MRQKSPHSSEIFVNELLNSGVPLSELTELLSFVLNADYSSCLNKIATNSAISLSLSEASLLGDLIERRKNHFPMQYLTGRAYFRNISLSVKKGVFIPRPETEMLVELVKEYIKGIRKSGGYGSGKRFCYEGNKNGNEQSSATSRTLKIADLCAGTGAIGFSRANELKNVKVDLVEKYEPAFEVLKENGKNIDFQKNSSVDLFLTDGTEFGDSGKYDIVVSNPPYIPESLKKEQFRQELSFEPENALFTNDGIEMPELISRNAFRILGGSGVFFLEHFETLSSEIAEICKKVGFKKVRIEKDLNGAKRFIVASKSGD
jgi:release factor glutamine methyltransferase